MKKKNTNRSNSSFCLCFQSQDDFMAESVISLSRTKSFPISNQETMVVDKKRSSKSNGRSRKKSARRFLSKIVRAIMFESFLVKKIRNKKKIGQDPSRSNSSLSSSVGRISNMNQKLDREMKADSKISPSCRTSVSTIPSTTNSSLSDSSSFRYSSFRSNSFEFKPNHNHNHNHNFTEVSKQIKTVGRCRSSINGLFLLLISLLVLIFWGRVCAIFCTSTWVYFGPTRRESVEQVILEENENKLAEVESKEYKKRVIMEGLLERNHCRA